MPIKREPGAKLLDNELYRRIDQLATLVQSFQANSRLPPLSTEIQTARSARSRVAPFSTLRDPANRRCQQQPAKANVLRQRWEAHTSGPSAGP